MEGLPMVTLRTHRTPGYIYPQQADTHNIIIYALEIEMWNKGTIWDNNIAYQIQQIQNQL